MSRHAVQALLLSAYNHLALADLPRHEPSPGEVLVRVAACGICGSDVHGYDGSSGRRIPPIVMGHEAAGAIVALGPGVDGFAPGDRVTFDSTVYCGACDFCRQSEVNLCDHREVLGVSCAEFRRAGAFAEFVTVPARILYHLPDDLPFAHAAMLEAVSVALHAVHLAAPGSGQTTAGKTALGGTAPGETALILGAGMVGLLLLQAARVAGYRKVFVADLDPTRLQLATQLGADATFPSLDDLPTGVETVFEAVGRDETVAAAIRAVCKGGAVVLVGNITPKVTLPLQAVVSRQVRLQGSCASAGEYPEAIRLLASGQIDVAPLITAVAPLAEGPQWFARLHAREPNLMKVILTPQPSS